MTPSRSKRRLPRSRFRKESPQLFCFDIDQGVQRAAVENIDKDGSGSCVGP
jgi:hypothetical protein